MAKVTLKYQSWKKFLREEPILLDNLWDLVPKPMEVDGIEEIVLTDKILYFLSYNGKKYLAWSDEIDEFIEDKNDKKSTLGSADKR